MKSLQIKNDTTVVSAFCRKSGNPIVVNDDGDGPLWAWSDNPYASAPSHIVRANNIQEAIEIVYDLLNPIDEDEIFEAYGFDSDEEFRAAVVENGEQPELIEGYHYQSTGTGTGIVSVDPCEQIWELSPEAAREQVKLVVRHWDDVD